MNNTSPVRSTRARKILLRVCGHAPFGSFPPLPSFLRLPFFSRASHAAVKIIISRRRIFCWTAWPNPKIPHKCRVVDNPGSNAEPATLFYSYQMHTYFISSLSPLYPSRSEDRSVLLVGLAPTIPRACTTRFRCDPIYWTRLGGYLDKSRVTARTSVEVTKPLGRKTFYHHTIPFRQT